MRLSNFSNILLIRQLKQFQCTLQGNKLLVFTKQTKLPKRYCHTATKPWNYRSRDPHDIFASLKTGNRSALASAITYMESTRADRRKTAETILQLAVEHGRQSQNTSLRLGLTGAPGAGKSTVIETLGKRLTSEGRKVAVLAVDPSSAKTGGSLLGDRTRMTELARDPNAYIRPSPAAGTLGGVTRSTNEAIVLCEAAGYDVIIVETVGVGQSELAVSDMVDMFVLIIPPAAGDELQGIKKGIVEMADLILINKADGDLLHAAKRIQAEYTSALKLLRPSTPLWKPKVTRVSALHDEGFDKAWRIMDRFHKTMLESGYLYDRRQQQHRTWMWNYIRDNIMDRFHRDAAVQKHVCGVENMVRDGLVAPSVAADRMLRIFTKDDVVE